MEIFNPTGLSFGVLPGRLRPPGFSLTVIVKGTFSLTHEKTATLAPEKERFFLDGDQLHDENPLFGLRYASDFAPFKLRADFLVTGTCHTPRGERLTGTYAAIEIASLRKQIAIIGDRRWIGEGPAAMPSAPDTFRTMPLRYDRSYGGPGFAKNPIGRGRGDFLPNLELPAKLIQGPSHTPDPAGFGPLDATWAPRATRLGTYDNTWLAERWPGFPEDFDFAHFNAAPLDQQIEKYLRGDEPIAFEHMHPDHSRFESRLPGVRVRCFLRTDPKKNPEPREVALNLDTAWVDVDTQKLCLVWRGITTTTTRDASEILKALVVTEDLTQPPILPRVYAEPRFWERPVEAEEAAKKTTAAREQPKKEESPSEVDIEVQKGLDDVRVMLEKANVPRDVLDKFKGVKDPDVFLAIALAQLPQDPEAAERVVKDSRERTKKLLADLGYDPALLDEPEEKKAEENAPSPWTRESVAASAAQGGVFVEENLAGLDLSGLDLRKLVFAKANLTATNLTHARLDGADLSGARMERAKVNGASLVDATVQGADALQADFSGADLFRANFAGANLRKAKLVGARLDDADLTKATLVQADLSRASFESAEMAEANLSETHFQGAKGARASFVQANLTGADMRETELDAADFSGAILDRVRLGRAKLRNAAFYGARGEHVSMVGADLTGMRARDGASFWRGEFKGARADGSNWAGASLREVDLREVSLVRADLSGADLEMANLHRAVLEYGNMSKANLERALLTAVNLFQGSLEGANLTKTDCRGSNLYGVEFLDASIVETLFEGTNLKATKLAGRST